jgi:2,4-dienoyl-CoA reductase-like NADH-dependent reductase (Old Yellow Enzyme family)/thioredoxin reductase
MASAQGRELYPHLFSPFRIGSLQLPNRITMAAMYTASGSANGMVTERQINYYRARAAAGVALITTELIGIDPYGFSNRFMLRIDHDRYVAPLHRLTDAIHDAGGRIAAQLAHQGRMVASTFSQRTPIAPSPVAFAMSETPRALRRDEIPGLVESFARAAILARQAGFDAVELHMAHGYLINEFFSKLTNQRTDDYGGDLRGRARFGLEVVAAVRAAVGSDLPIICKHAVNEGVPGGYDSSEGAEIARMLEQAGADAISTSVSEAQGQGSEFTKEVPPMYFAPGSDVPLAEAVKATVRIPVGARGRINTPELAEEILAAGNADFVVIGRGLNADHEWALKASQGRSADICPCIGCLQGCFDRLIVDLPISCLTNPRAANEADYPWTLAPRRRHVLVVGGGPAGMQAALTASRRGHRVTLWDKSPHLGGAFVAAASPPGKADFNHFTSYMTRELKKAEVVLTLGKIADAQAVAAVKPDVVIVAIGAAVATPQLAGDGTMPVLDLYGDLYLRDVPGKSLVVLGGSRACCETAQWLAAKGKQVTLIAEDGRLLRDAGMYIRRVLTEQIRDSEISVYLKARVVSASNGTMVMDRDGIRDSISGIDAVVVAGERRPNADLAQELRQAGLRTIVVGDAANPRDAYRATQDAFAAAYNLE